MWLHRAVPVLFALLLVAGACGERPSGALGRELSGCEEALRERAVATDAIDSAEKQAIARNAGRAGELQGIAAEGKHAVLSAADLAPCEARDGGSGVAVDLADLRARYRVVIDAATQRLTETAAKPAPPPPAQPQRGNDGRGKDNDKDRGKKDDD